MSTIEEALKHVEEAQRILKGFANLPDSGDDGVHQTRINGVSQYRLSPTSLKNLEGVKPELVKVVKAALAVSLQDFSVFEGLRTADRQKQLLGEGRTRTLKSKHLIQPDGYGWAVDLVPWIGGKLSWDWTGCYRIACAMDRAATELGYADHIRWGGAWDRVLADYGGDETEYLKEVQAYKNRHAGPDFIDGPHFEWVA